MGNTPKLRFEGYSGDWGRHTLGDVFTQTSNYVNPKEDGIELWSLTVEDGLTPKTERYVREFLVKKDDKFKEVRPGDIVYNPMNMTLGAVGYNGMDHSVAVSGYYTTMVAGKDYDAYFINTWLKSPQAILLYKTYATGTLLEKQRVQFPTLSMIPASIPRLSEQKDIGIIFESIDVLISLYQNKCNALSKAQKYFLQSIFPIRREKTPKIRIEGFNYEWNHFPLKKVADKVTEKNSGYEFTETFTNSAEHGIISQQDFFDHSVSSEENINGYYVVRPDDFVYNPRISILAPYGPINRNKLGRCGVMSPLYSVFKVHSIDLTYLEWFFKSSSWHPFMYLNGDSGARSDRFAIKDALFFEMPIPIPTIEEQKAIGEFLEEINSLLSLSQRKLNALKTLKKILLQNMFA